MIPASRISLFRWRLTISEWAWILLFISLPAGRPFTTYTLVLVVAISLLSIRIIETEYVKQNLKSVWPMLLFFFFHLTGMLYTDDFDFGFKDLSVKIPLVLIPVIAVFTGISDSLKKKAAIAFSYSCVTVNLFLLIRAVINHHSGMQDPFFYDSYSVLIHPAYMALMNVTAISILIFDDTSAFSKKKVISLLSIIFLSASAILMASKAGLLSMLIVYLAFAIKTFSGNRFSKFLLTGTIVMIALAIIFIFPVKERVKQSLEALRHPEKAATMQEGTASRLLAWQTAWHIAKDYFPLGTGTGDIKNVTLSYYEHSGYSWPLYYKLNAHNQYLQSVAAIGIGGLVSLAFILFIPLIHRKKEESLPLIFNLLVFINLLFESMLEVQNGVMLIASFYVLWNVRPSHLLNDT